VVLRRQDQWAGSLSVGKQALGVIMCLIDTNNLVSVSLSDPGKLDPV